MFGLSFLSPLFLAGALAAAVPIVLHLLGRRPDVQVSFPPVRLLTTVPAEQTRRRRLRDLLLLAMRVLAIVLLAVAFARPYLAAPHAADARRAVIVAIDRSFSMSAPGQFERAQAAARRAADEAGPGTAVGVVAFDDEAVVAVKPTTDRAAVARAIERLRPGYGGTSYSAALAKSAEALGAAPGRVVMVTDLQRNGWDRQDAAIPRGIEVIVRDVAGIQSNLSVSAVRSEDDKRLTALIRNSGTLPRNGHAMLFVNGHRQAVVPFSLPPGDAQRLAFPGPVASQGEAVVEIDDTQGYDADNRAYALLDPPDPPMVLVITGQGDVSRGSFYVQRALEVDGGRLYRVEAQDAAAFSRSPGATRLSVYAGVVLLGTRGLDAGAIAALREYLAAGGGMLVAAGDQVGADELDTLVGTRTNLQLASSDGADVGGLVVADARHPLMQSFSAAGFGNARFERVSRFQVPGGTVLARFGDGRPALVEMREGKGRLLLFASDLSNRSNDLPLQPAFLPLVHETVRYLAAGRLSPRDLLVAQLPADLPHQPGVITMPSGGGHAPSGTVAARRRIVVNVDSRESDVSRMSVTEFEAQIVRSGGAVPMRQPADAGQAEQQQGLWRALIALAIGLVLIEGLLAGGARRNRGRSTKVARA